MKRARWVCCTTSLLLAAVFAAPTAAADRERVVAADVAIERFTTQAWPEWPREIPPKLEWRRVQLPYIGWQSKPQAGERHFARIWVRLADVASANALPRALAYSAYLPTGFHAVFYSDGRQVFATDGALSNGWNVPVLVPLPPSDPGARTLVAAFDCYVGSLGCGVPSFQLGSLGAVSIWYEWQKFLRIDGPRVGSVAILIVGAFALLFWIRRRREVVYRLFFIASLLWMVRTLHYHLPRYPQPESWFWWATICSFSWLCVAVYLFSFRLQGERSPRIEKVLFIGATLSTVLGMPPIASGDYWVFERLAYVMQALISLAVTVILTAVAVKRRTRPDVVMAIALWIMFAMGIHDLLLLDWNLDMERVFLLPYAALPLFGAFIFAMARRYRRAIEDIEIVNASLESRLEARQRELTHSFEQLRQYEIRNAQEQERQRLMRDMHDGVGSSLISTLALVERGGAEPSLVAQTLRETVDELKLTIDSMEPIDQDIVTVLATLRYRMTPRLEMAGLALDWQVNEVPQLDWLDAPAALQIMRIVQECFGNILKHAQASRISLGCCADSGVVVRIADNGRGFDVAAQQSAPKGRGLRNLEFRARQIGGRISIDSDAGGTRIELRLPLERRTRPR